MKASARIAVIGASGRMGQEILNLAARDSRFQIVAGVSRSATPLVPESHSRVEDLKTGSIDVVIDFSQPELCCKVAEWCRQSKTALVSGVTGLSENDHLLLARVAEDIPVLWAPNMSLGINVLAEMMRSFAHLPGFEFQIEEVHHKQKKDRPSGTALYLQRKLEDVVGENLPQPLALRGGGVFGIHKVWAMGTEEVLTIEHVAMNRAVFARGALEAAVWIRGKPSGLYGMANVLRQEGHPLNP